MTFIITTTFSSFFSFVFAQTFSGGFVSLVICSDQTVKSFGSWRLGNGTKDVSKVPVKVPGISNTIAVASSYGGEQLVLLSDGTVMTFMGDKTSLSPTKVGDKEVLSPIKVSSLTDVKAVARGIHSVVLKKDGTVWCWGYNKDGELGRGNNKDSYIPEQVSGLTDVIAISAESYATLALKSDGTVWSWGRGKEGQLGNGKNKTSNVPVQVLGLTDVVAIAGGSPNGIAIKKDGTVWIWGWGADGRLGDGKTKNVNTPIQITSLTDIVAAASGNTHSLFLKKDGTVWACGNNAKGQLGDGTTENRGIPVQVKGLTGIIAISCGYDHSMALKNDGTLWGFGNNQWGQIGIGDTKFSETPVKILDLGNKKNDSNTASEKSFCVPIVLKNTSTGIGSVSTSYLCYYFDVPTTTMSKEEIKEAAIKYLGTMIPMADYTIQEVFFFENNCNECKSKINAKYTLSSSQVNRLKL
ncbi:MAG: hypothetical protein A2309_11170 [Bacteroidetes bacterium RIFOXYB2_FULL_35_7]|nr:MAG: hypothetical protein A2491_06560 [Bacteroidetes bacterium RIFOXYC12_FULL_35_7]OFY97240.1 MAG: hypothetical protein A2309_11170 [Bacteroidetes bacterium RIFOXYB2_FULL_35_7]